MTTARSSRRSSWIGALALVWVAHASLSAHRLDEYLQAARLAIDPDRVEISLDLTPGVAVAEQVLAEIDRDRDHVISTVERQAYVAQVLGAVGIDVDGHALRVDAIDSIMPPVDDILKGAGTMRVRAQASLPRLSGGAHHVHYRNTHRPDIAVYLANALMPTSERIAVTSQARDVDQRELTIEYTLSTDLPTRVRAGMSAALTGALILLAIRWRRRRLDQRVVV